MLRYDGHLGGRWTVRGAGVLIGAAAVGGGATLGMLSVILAGSDLGAAWALVALGGTGALIACRLLLGTGTALAAAAAAAAAAGIVGRDGLIALACAGLGAAAHLAWVERRTARRQGDPRPSLALAAPLLGLLALLGGLAMAVADVAVWAALVAALAGLARAVAPPAGRAPVSGWTLANTLAGYGAFATACLLLPLVAPAALLLPGGRARWIARALRVAMLGVFRATPSTRWRLGGDTAQLARARVVVSNHEGMLDILAACALPGTRTLLAKTWVFRAFPLGLAARAAGLRNSDELDADDYRGGADATLGDDLGIFVFPEGTRSKDGRIGRFRPGAFVLARSLGAAVVPVAVAGSRQGIRPGSLWIRPTRVTSRVLAPLAASEDEPHRAWAERCRVQIAGERASLARASLGCAGWRRNRRERFIGLAPAARRAAAAEERAPAWALLARVPVADGGDWLLLGVGDGVVPLALRQVAPAARLIGVEAEAGRRAVARHVWWEDGDVLAERLEAAPLPERLAGVVAWSTPTPAEAAAVAGRSPAVLLVAQPDAWIPHLPTHRLVDAAAGLSALVAAAEPG